MLHNIAGHQPDVLNAIQLPQIAILLIGEGFERSRIDDALVALLSLPDGKFSHQRLPGSGWCRHQH